LLCAVSLQAGTGLQELTDQDFIT